MRGFDHIEADTGCPTPCSGEVSVDHTAGGEVRVKHAAGDEVRVSHSPRGEVRMSQVHASL